MAEPEIVGGIAGHCFDIDGTWWHEPGKCTDPWCGASYTGADGAFDLRFSAAPCCAPKESPVPDVVDRDNPNALRPDQHLHRCARWRMGCPHRWPCLTSACTDLAEERLTCSPCHPTSIEKRGDPLASKRSYVRSQPQTRAHACHWPGCTEQVPPALWGCKPHWMKLPKALRDRVWAAYRPRQEVDLDPTAEYLAVADEVQAWIRTQTPAAPAQRSLF